jgi:signal transduction histidine kinase
MAKHASEPASEKSSTSSDQALAALEAQHQAMLLGLNHELRTPLTLIHSNAELLSASGGLSEDQRRFLAGILEGVHRAQAVVGQLADGTHALGGTHVPI